jgi:hypothetical protein
MPTSFRETTLAAIATRLAAQITTATVERGRRAPVNTDDDPDLPLLLLTGDEMAADLATDALHTYYALGFTVQGYVRAASGLAAEQALHALQAQVTAALAAWEPATAGIQQPVEVGADFLVYSADDADRPAGEFTARWTITIETVTGNPYAA